MCTVWSSPINSILGWFPWVCLGFLGWMAATNTHNYPGIYCKYESSRNQMEGSRKQEADSAWSGRFVSLPPSADAMWHCMHVCHIPGRLPTNVGIKVNLSLVSIGPRIATRASECLLRNALTWFSKRDAFRHWRTILTHVSDQTSGKRLTFLLFAQ